MLIFGNSFKTRMETSFGMNPMEDLPLFNASDRMDEVRRLHEALRDEADLSWEVDDITWSDLEMDQVFLRINHTNSCIGEQALYRRMHLLDRGFNQDEVKQQEKKLEYLKTHPEFRARVERRLRLIGKRREAYYLPEFLLSSKVFKLGNSLVFHGLQALLVIFFLLMLFLHPAFLIGFILVAVVNMLIYIYMKQRYETFFYALMQFKNIYDFGLWMVKKDKDGAFVDDKIRSDVHKLRKMTWIIMSMGSRRLGSVAGDLMFMIVEYISGILLIDVAMFNHIMNIISDKQDEVLSLLEFAGRVDSDIAIASYRKSISRWCTPDFVPYERAASTPVDLPAPRRTYFRCTGIAHPLLQDPVTNDFELTDKAILTGSNASGKSTFMKSVAINTILAQTINTCIADEISMQPLMVVSCMALRDDIQSGESYYLREAKCLKRILDLITKEDRVLVVIDEILKGTNTIERIASSKAILDFVGSKDCLTLVATHDNELTETDLYRNYHFCSQIVEDDILFDYILHDGKNTQSNAIELLAYLGYPESIVEKARENVART